MDVNKLNGRKKLSITFSTDISGYTLQSHDCASAGFFGDASLSETIKNYCGTVVEQTHLFSIDDVHDNTTLIRARQSETKLSCSKSDGL